MYTYILEEVSFYIDSKSDFNVLGSFEYQHWTDHVKVFSPGYIRPKCSIEHSPLLWQGFVGWRVHEYLVYKPYNRIEHSDRIHHISDGQQ